MNIKEMLECCFPKTMNSFKINNKQEFFNLIQDKEENTTINDRKIESDSLTHTKSDKVEKMFEEEKEFPLVPQRSLSKENIESPKFYNHTHQKSLGSVHNIINSNTPNILTNVIKMNSIKGKSPKDNNSIYSFNNGQNNFSLNNSQDVSKMSNNRIPDDSSLDFVNLNRLITETDVKSSYGLLLEEIEGDILKNNKFIINPYGLVNGARKAKDGVSYFGTKYKNNEGVIINDYVLNIDSNGLGPYVFVIYYKKDTKKYYLRTYRDIANPGLSLILIKLDYQYIIRKKEIIAIGDVYFQLQIFYDRLEITKLASKASPETINYSFLNDSGDVTVGRDKNCTINFVGNKSFSRINCTFLYDKETQCWKVQDGNKNKLSTNGTWIFAAHSYEIHDSTIFKIANSKLRISMTKEF